MESLQKKAYCCVGRGSGNPVRKGKLGEVIMGLLPALVERFRGRIPLVHFINYILFKKFYLNCLENFKIPPK